MNENTRNILLSVFLVFCSPNLLGKQWQLDTDHSRVDFIFTQAGSDTRGEFKDFSAEFIFDENNLSTSKFSVVIQLGGLDSGDSERDELLRSDELFNIKKWPTARFETRTIKSLGKNNYEAAAELTIRDKTLPITFAFSLKTQGHGKTSRFHMQSKTPVSRLKFEVGKGDWADTTWIGDEVIVDVNVYAILQKKANDSPDN